MRNWQATPSAGPAPPAGQDLLFTPGPRLGWVFRDRRELAAPYPEPEPSPHAVHAQAVARMATAEQAWQRTWKWVGKPSIGLALLLVVLAGCARSVSGNTSPGLTAVTIATLCGPGFAWTGWQWLRREQARDVTPEQEYRVEWGKLDRMPRIPLAKGERQRERVLTDAEIKLYLENCRQPWEDAAALILGAGMRPGEVYGLRWEFVLLNGHGGLIQVSEGKSKAARRILPMIPDVYDALKARHKQQGRPAQGWVFPTSAKCGHLEQGTAKTQHSAALAKANAAAIKDKLPPPLKPFEPYVMRHTALTRMAPFCDPFTLARIAGHSSITITQRYCHPQANAVEAAFSKFGSREEVVTDGGHHEKQLPPMPQEQQQVSITVV